MADDAHDKPSEIPVSKNKSVAVRIAGVLASVPFASVVVALITVACIAGTLLPQGSQVRQYIAAHPEREGLMELLDFVGLTHVFTSSWFVGLLLLLAASLAVCSYKRYAASTRLHGRAQGRALGSLGAMRRGRGTSRACTRNGPSRSPSRAAQASSTSYTSRTCPG